MRRIYKVVLLPPFYNRHSYVEAPSWFAWIESAAITRRLTEEFGGANIKMANLLRHA